MLPPSQLPKKRRWLGVLLSFFIPGFGLVRAGFVRRGIAWFLGLELVVLIMILCFVLSAVPLWVALVLLLVAIVGEVWMWIDSFRPGRMSARLWWIFAILVAVSFWLPSPILAVFGSFRIQSGAMEPTLLGGGSASVPDHVLVDRMSHRFRAPERGELIVFSISGIPGIQSGGRSGGEGFFVMRIVGLPGERIRIENGRVLADGSLLDREDGIPPIHYKAPHILPGMPSMARREGEDFIVGAGEYFVLGDNSSNSYDSRYWGCVPASAVHGKVTAICFPLNRLGRLSPGNTPGAQ